MDGCEPPCGSEHIAMYDIFVQTQHPSGECMYASDGDEQFDVDLDGEETVWDLPGVHRRSLQALSGLRGVKNSEPETENTQCGISVTYSELIGFCLFPESPKVTVFPKNPVELGQPNVLICVRHHALLPVLNVTWLCNQQLVPEGTSETFHYLTIIPTAQDVYNCRVEHWGQGQPSLGHWVSVDLLERLFITPTWACLVPQYS
uniref:Ig-like domain-containing protein n=1 Tax=Mus spicilegus TaxID=10103 RepID=A0A8C6MU30_MUSSI